MPKPAPRRDVLKPSDYVRCICGQLLERRRATKVDGRWYGRDCLRHLANHLAAGRSSDAEAD